MRFNNRLDLNLLIALDHLLNLRSVSAAALRMNVTQSTMSSALGRLREYFDDELLVKIGRSLELTPRAEALKESVRDLLVRIEWTISTTPEFDPAQSERCFKILASDYTLTTLGPRLLARCQAVAPGVQFQFLHQVRAPDRLLERGDVDLLLIPLEFCGEQNPSELILEETFCVIAWTGGKFGQGPLSREDFLGASHVVMEPNWGTQSLETYHFHSQNIRRRIDVTTFSFATVPHLIIGTDRIATVHRRLADVAGKGLPLTLHDLPLPLPPMRQAMQWHRYRSNDAGLIWLRDMIKGLMQPGPQLEAAAIASPPPQP